MGLVIKHLAGLLLAFTAGVRVVGGTPIRGVNLGGWLLAEQWLVPSLFAQTNNDSIVDEWTFGYAPNAAKILNHHWDTFITENDFTQMANAGINYVRIPIGYWAYDSSAGEPYVRANQSAYLSRAVGWAQAHNIKVMVDLHGLPGSQNGKQNSGHAGPINWPSAASNANRAAKIVQSIASDFSSNKGTVTHIELANEPVMERSNDIKSYTQSYYSSAAPQASEFSATLHDGFLPLSDWYGFDAGGDTNFVVDTHYYSMYPYYGNSGVSAPAYNNISDSTLRKICQLKPALAGSQSHHSTIVGEWSIAQGGNSRRSTADQFEQPGVYRRNNGGGGSSPTTDRWRRGQDGRYLGRRGPSYPQQLFDTQRAVFEETTSGWMFFTWKAESSSTAWSYQNGLKNGWITPSLDAFSASAC